METDTGSIKPINRKSIHRICSGQVILDLATAIKELVENALDAGATNIEVRLREYGSSLVEVADNGKGVPPADYQALTLKYHTSKITSFDDLTSVSTYGFRGEALSSLCAVSELSVVTRTADQDAGVRLEYDHEGTLTGRTPTPRAVGTTVAVKNLFATMPVRHKEFTRNLKREFARAVSVLQAYALVATHARLVVTNQAGKGSARTSVFTTAAPAAAYEAHVAAAAGGPSGAASTPAAQSSPSLAAVTASPAGAAADPRIQAHLAALRDNVVAVFGGRVAEALEPLVLPEDPETGVQLAGWVSRAGCGLKGDTSRQYFFLNGRPVDLPKAARVLNDSFKSLSSPAHAASCRPMAVLAVSLAAADVDVNVTPDKRRVFMAAEDRMCGLLQQALQALWEPSRCTFTVNQPLPVGPSGAQGTAAAIGGAGGGSLLVTGQAGARGGSSRQPRQTKLSVLRESPATVAPDPCVQAERDDDGDAGNDTTAADGDLGGAGKEEHSADGYDGSHPRSKRRRLSDDADPGPDGAGGRSQGSPDGGREGSLLGAGAVEPSPHAAGRKAAMTAALGAARAAARAGAAPGEGPNRKPSGSFFGDFAAAGKGGPPRSAAAAAASSKAASKRRELEQDEAPAFSVVAATEAAGPEADGAEDIGRLHDHAVKIKEEPMEHGASEGQAREYVMENVRRVRRVRHGADGLVASQPDAAEEQGAGGWGSTASAGAVKASRRASSTVKVEYPEADENETAAAAVAATLGPWRHGSGAVREAEAAGLEAMETDAAAAGGAAEEAEAMEADVEVAVTLEEDKRQRGGLEPDKPNVAAAEAAETAAGAGLQSSPPGAFNAAAAAAGPAAASAPAAVLRLEPGQLAELTASRVRHLQALRQRTQQQHPLEGYGTAGGGGGGGQGAGTSGSRFRSSSLQDREDGPGGDAVGEARAGGGGGGPGGGAGGTRAEREAAAERELERVFRKQQFKEMRVLGQFNLGFILARHGSDVFIVDQHAAAEKTTFERLQRTVTLTRQPLLVPRPLPHGQLLPVDQLLIRDHIDVFRRNGFDFVERRPDGRIVPLPGTSRQGTASAAASDVEGQQNAEDGDHDDGFDGPDTGGAGGGGCKGSCHAGLPRLPLIHHGGPAAVPP